MSGEALIRELRKLQVWVIHPEDAACNELIRHLKRIGCQVNTQWPIPESWPVHADVVFCLFSGHLPIDVSALRNGREGTLIGIVEYESPTIVRELLDADAQAIIAKPIHPFGILSTLSVASSRYRFERRQNSKIVKLEETLRSRRVVNNAVRRLATERSISEDQAYQLIRRWSLEQRVSMTRIADHFIAIDEGRDDYSEEF
ncbi:MULTISPECIES: ANTAR domain-containing response regulator [Mesorhizobium]|uniref:Two-component response regulator, AmiR/NasT family, consists of REC and RNA-binding antiterminator (ANTAR) domains n=1 Tax=Mesorhizobium australicum TaxID=536018 RepID=A0A1X7MPW8_9HYPH|nr:MULTISPECIES: ANTAR domain-containing protein [Mesorhizobium]SMH26381.1 Two-component response regulator, AmiR/NasT family, consists of REC and RNA-binding antiterminator (ANTAR) domains [Mesorhizobium australicum]